MEENNLSPVSQNNLNSDGKDSSFSFKRVFSVRWIRILFVLVLLILFFVLARLVSSQLVLLIVTVLPLFIGFGLAQLLNPLITFFRRFFHVKVSKIISFSMLCTLFLVLFLGLFILFFIQLDRVHNSLIKGVGKDEFTVFLRNIYTPVADGGIDPNNIEKVEFVSKQHQIELSVYNVGENEPDLYSYEKDEVGGLYSVLFFLTDKIPSLKNIIFNLIRITYKQSTGSYIEWLFKNYYIFLVLLYLFSFSLLIAAFGMGKSKNFFSTIWLFFVKGQAPEVTQELEIQLKQSMSSWFRGFLIEQIYAFVFTILLLLVVGLSFRNNSSYLENSLLITLYMAVFNLIPYIGPWIGITGTVAIGLVDTVQYGPEEFFNWLPFILATSGAFLVQVGQSAIVSPLVYSYQVKLSPITIIIGLAIVGVLFGFFALIFAIPLILLVKIILRVVYQKEWNI